MRHAPSRLERCRGHAASPTPGGSCPVGGLRPLREMSLLPGCWGVLVRGSQPRFGLSAPRCPQQPPTAPAGPSIVSAGGCMPQTPPHPAAPLPVSIPPPCTRAAAAGPGRAAVRVASRRDDSAPGGCVWGGRGGDPGPAAGSRTEPPQLPALRPPGPWQRCQRCHRPVLSHSGGSRPPAAGGGCGCRHLAAPTGGQPRGWQHPRVPGMGWGWPQPPPGAPARSWPLSP